MAFRIIYIPEDDLPILGEESTIRATDLYPYQLWSVDPMPDGTFELAGRSAMLGAESAQDIIDRLLDLLHGASQDVLEMTRLHIP